jgi:hypothetical protein
LDFMIKKLNTEKTREKYEKYLLIKEEKIAECKAQCDKEKKEKIEAAKDAYELKRKIYISSKERKMEESKGKLRPARTATNAYRSGMVGLQFQQAMLNDMTQNETSNQILNDIT